MARDLIDLGYRSVSGLKGEDPETMYRKLCELRGQQIDRCVLYEFRCAVYFAGAKQPDPELLKWWNWKDNKSPVFQSLEMEEKLIAPCGMNCGLCANHLAMTHDLNKKGFKKKYCSGCLPRGKNCLFMQKQCDLVGKGLVRFCYECKDFPCRRLKDLDKRYRTKYHLSMIENLELIKKQGIEKFLEKEAAKWQCPECGDAICCHNGLCLNCDIEKLRQKRTYRWDE
jgi:hypothetical protein